MTPPNDTANPGEAPNENAPHLSVLLNESLRALNLPQQASVLVDATLGAGGHSAALLERLAPGSRLIGIDTDTTALDIARKRLEPIAAQRSVTLNFVHSNFRHIKEILAELQAPAPHGILADVGLSSMQLDSPGRGFSFRADEPLDMRMDQTQGLSAADILRDSSESEIADILFHLGEEYKAYKIARTIVNERQRSPIDTTGKLEETVRRALRIRGHRRIHPATKTFQALRIAVNRELEALDTLLADAPDLLAPGGTLAIISFHSLEDRRVKQAFKALIETSRFNQMEKFERPSEEEENANPRSRSAKLRAVTKIVL